MKTLNCVLVWGLLFFAGTDLWAIPAGFNIQGRLTDVSGINKDGTFSIKFSVYDANNTLAWEKTMAPVLVQNGNFQILLQGEGQGPGGTSLQLETAVKDLEAAYLEIKVGSDPPLVPRQPLMRSPFSSPVKFTGAVMFFAGATCPDGWLLANGATLPATGVDAAKYADLFNYLGTAYDPSHVNVMLPNMLDGSFLRGTGGNAVARGIKQTDAFQGHKHMVHSMPPHNWPGGYSGGGWFGDPSWGDSDADHMKATPTTDGTNGDPRPASETRPINYAMTPCVKY